MPLLPPRLGGLAAAGAAGLLNRLVPDPAKAVIMEDPLTLKPGAIPLVIQSQFPVREMTLVRNFQQATGVGMANAPNVSFNTSRDPDTFTIEMKWVAEHMLDSGPRVAREALEELSALQPDGTFRTVLLVWGSLSKRVQFVRMDHSLLEGVDLITLSERMLVVACTFREVSQLRVDPLPTTEGATTYHEVSPTDTWAAIALRYYGAPSASVRLAAVNRSRSLEPTAGDTIRVLDATNSQMVGLPEPSSIAINVLPIGVVQDSAAAAFEFGPAGSDWEALAPRFTSPEWSP